MFFSAIIEKCLGQSVQEISALAGGDINEVYKVSLSRSQVVVKINKKDAFPDMFSREASGLKLLSSAGCTTPEIIGSFTEENYQLLVLEYLPEERPTLKYWETFGRHLARLHQFSSDAFGLEEENYIGSLSQRNGWRSNWPDFFIECRLLPMISRAFDRSLLDSTHKKDFESLFLKMKELVPNEPASLLHGDLWSGNLMCGLEQNPVFIDPAVYFGHREVDIAMTHMFGGFDPSYLESYTDVFPLEAGWENRLELHNLYPYLVHLNLFGRSYLGRIEQILKRYS